MMNSLKTPAEFVETIASLFLAFGVLFFLFHLSILYSGHGTSPLFLEHYFVRESDPFNKWVFRHSQWVESARLALDGLTIAASAGLLQGARWAYRLFLADLMALTMLQILSAALGLLYAVDYYKEPQFLFFTGEPTSIYAIWTTSFIFTAGMAALYFWILRRMGRKETARLFKAAVPGRRSWRSKRKK